MQFVVPSILLLKGKWSFGPFDIKTGTLISISIPRDGTWESKDGVSIAGVDTELSFDNGKNWLYFLGFEIALDNPMMNISKDDKSLIPLAQSGVVSYPLITPCQLRGTFNLLQSLPLSLIIDVN